MVFGSSFLCLKPGVPHSHSVLIYSEGHAMKIKTACNCHTSTLMLAHVSTERKPT